ncbi:MAG: hypothetical protein ACFFD2_15965 [Promethearchaeota archaeon]
MRLFIIEEQLKNWLFDLDGNVFHTNLRNQIKIGMIVGVRVAPRQASGRKRVELLENYKEYLRLHKKYMKFIETRKQQIQLLNEEIKKIITKIMDEIESLEAAKEVIQRSIFELKFRIEQETNSDVKNKWGDEISILLGQKGTLNKKILKKFRDIDRLNSELEYPNLFFYKNLIMEYNPLKELLDSIEMEFEEYDQLYDLRRKVTEGDDPWTETVFLKVVKKTNKKLYGDVIERFRRPNSKCTLKKGDRISFYSKNIMFVPSLLNKKSQFKSYYVTDYSYKYYKTDKVTDWDGVFLDKSARDYITPGSIVRIQLKPNIQEFGSVWYTYILEREGDYFYGELLDYYKLDLDEEKYDNPLKIGCIHRFWKECIIEIPISWNPHLKMLPKLKNRDNWGYLITGYREGGSYYKLPS